MKKDKDGNNTVTLIQMVDCISFAPAKVGTLVRIDLDASTGETLWYEKQYRDEKRNYVVWRRIEAPPPREPDVRGLDEQDVIANIIGQRSSRDKGPIHWVESRGDIERKIKFIESARTGLKVLRVWEDEV